MPRISTARRPAEPSSPEQKDRYRRILRAAALQGADKGLERMQMHDVAKDAGVAIATLYRYFPSKTHLFTALMAARVERLSEYIEANPPGDDRVAAVSELLITALREMQARPKLAQAMVQSNNASVAEYGSAVTRVFADLMLQILGVDEPSSDQRRAVRLTEAAWFGILVSRLNGLITDEEAELDTQMACRRLLIDF